MTEAVGWAVVASGARIYINSVAATRRAALVNWLCVEKQCLVTNSYTDEDIENLWKHHGQYVDVRPVSISDMTIPDRKDS